MIVPVKTYQVHASGVLSHTYNITPRATAIPVITPLWLARFVKTPSKKAPNMAPYGSDAIVSAVLRTDFVKLFDAMAMTIRTRPHTTVNQRDIRNRDSSDT